MANAITSVVIASASAVAKVFVIGAIGYVAAKRPRPVPILPPHAMNAISKMNFDLLIIPLVYSTLASAVTPERLGSLWFVLVSGVGVICLSYMVATLLEKLPFFRVENRTDFDALRIAAAFPNIVALPILIFPALCEFTVVSGAFYDGEGGDSEAEKYRSCVDQSNSMIFVYFFAWNLLYWMIGFPNLVDAGQKRQLARSESASSAIAEPELPVVDVFKSEQATSDALPHGEHEQSNPDDRMPAGEEDVKVVEANQLGEEQPQSTSDAREGIKYFLYLFGNALLQTIKSPGFVAMILGILTACIPPLRDALFSHGGALRFFGSAMQSMGSASSSVGTLIVAASLVHQAEDDSPSAVTVNDPTNDNQCDAAELGSNPPEGDARRRVPCKESISNTEPTREDSIDLKASMRRRRSSLSQMSTKAIAAIRRTRKPTIRMHSWFVASRLIVAPALVCLIIIAMDCGGALSGIPNLAKMVVIVNAGLPGAQLIIITLKSKGLSDSASVVAQVYLPSYLLSVVTIAAWTSLALMISIPREDGSSFCKR